MSIKCIAWNPNGIRSLLQKSSAELIKLLQDEQPDMIFFIETKGNPTAIKTVNDALKAIPYLKDWEFHHACCVNKPGRHGVSLAFNPEKVQPRNLFFGFDETSPIDEEGRIIGVDLGHTTVYGVYVPNASQGLKRLDFKEKWLKALSDAIAKRPTPTLVIGDINVAPDERDICNPEQNLKTPGFTIEERKAYASLMEQCKLVDLWRFSNPQTLIRSQGKNGVYTFWNTKSRARERNAGWRIDLCLASQQLIDDKLISDPQIHGTYLGSDHCPISCVLHTANHQ